MNSNKLWERMEKIQNKISNHIGGLKNFQTKHNFALMQPHPIISEHRLNAVISAIEDNSNELVLLYKAAGGKHKDLINRIKDRYQILPTEAEFLKNVFFGKTRLSKKTREKMKQKAPAQVQLQFHGEEKTTTAASGTNIEKLELYRVAGRCFTDAQSASEFSKLINNSFQIGG